MKTSKLAYIIPAHKADVEKLTAAIDSVFSQTETVSIIVSAPQAVFDALNPDLLSKINAVVWKAKGKKTPSFQQLVNAGVNYATEMKGVEWVSILEYDDRLLPKATETFVKYRESFPDTDVFAGLALVVEPGTPPALKNIANEGSWVAGIMETAGILDFNAMLRMNFLLVSAAFYKLQSIQADSIGLFKHNMKYFYDYEFALRLVYNGLIVRSIPRVTHYHFIGGEATEQLAAISKDEREFWLNASRKEYFFENDRNVVYLPKEAEVTGA